MFNIYILLLLLPTTTMRRCYASFQIDVANFDGSDGFTFQGGSDNYYIGTYAPSMFKLDCFQNKYIIYVEQTS
jgi:hypothetical protein